MCFIDLINTRIHVDSALVKIFRLSPAAAGHPAAGGFQRARAREALARGLWIAEGGVYSSSLVVLLGSKPSQMSGGAKRSLKGVRLETFRPPSPVVPSCRRY